MGVQYFQINCKYCSQRFGIQTEQGKTVKCNCPFCGKENIVAAPLIGTAQKKTINIMPKTKKNDKFGRKIVIGFLIFATIIIMVSIILYIVFTRISN